MLFRLGNVQFMYTLDGSIVAPFVFREEHVYDISLGADRKLGKESLVQLPDSKVLNIEGIDQPVYYDTLVKVTARYTNPDEWEYGLFKIDTPSGEEDIKPYDRGDMKSFLRRRYQMNIWYQNNIDRELTKRELLYLRDMIQEGLIERYVDKNNETTCN